MLFRHLDFLKTPGQELLVQIITLPLALCSFFALAWAGRDLQTWPFLAWLFVVAIPGTLYFVATFSHPEAVALYILKNRDAAKAIAEEYNRNYPFFGHFEERYEYCMQVSKISAFPLLAIITAAYLIPIRQAWVHALLGGLYFIAVKLLAIVNPYFCRWYFAAPRWFWKRLEEAEEGAVGQSH